MPLLLAPGGSLNSALTVLDQGADALYIGLKGHSRGGFKGELGEADLALCIKKAQEKGKGLYLAFNLIPEARNIKFLLDKIDYYLSCDITGVILNEPSLIHKVAQKFPSLNITASIGCAISNLQEALFYKELGAKSLVLGPQVGLREIARIKAEINCQLEVFIYGFHEMFTLGKCWLGGYVKSGIRSSELGTVEFAETRNPNPVSRSFRGSPKRSGVCGQVCGLIGNLTSKSISNRWDVGARHAVPLQKAPRPFYVLRSLKKLMEAGVDVFKLGGRYFQPEQTPPLVAFYRQLLDSLVSSGTDFSWEPWEAEAQKLFPSHAQELVY